MRRALAAASAALLLVACSGGTTPEPDGNVLSVPDNGDRHGTKEAKTDKPKKREAQGAEDGAGTEGTRERSRSDAPSGSGRDSGSGDGKSAENGAPSLPLPAAGSYTYVQTGWEELCRAANCDRSRLPPSQTTKISFEDRSPTRAVFVSETRDSGSRNQAITYDVGSERASITRLESTFAAGAFRFTAEIVPDPPVTAALFPLQVGDRWSGRWEDRGGSVDGSYDFEVVERDSMKIDGHAENVVVVDTTMRLSGDYRGVNEMRLWVVPEIFTIVASKGFTEIESSYGTYRSRFTTSYDSGPRG